MKNQLIVTGLSIVFSVSVFANGETLTIREQAKGTAEIDEEYLDSLRDKKERQEDGMGQLERSESIYEKNPRNPAFNESFERVDQREEEFYQDIEERQSEQERVRRNKTQQRDFEDPR